MEYRKKEQPDVLFQGTQSKKSSANAGIQVSSVDSEETPETLESSVDPRYVYTTKGILYVT